MSERPHLVVVGGGVLGLTLALRLASRCRVTVLESAPAPGGLAASQQIGGYTWDRFYHVIAPGDTVLMDLLTELGLDDRLRWGGTRTGFFAGGRLVSMSTTLEFLRFPLLSLVDKFRLGLTILWASRIRRWEPLEYVRVTDWLRRWSGRRTLERIWVPLLKAKLGDNYRLASAAFIWAIIARMYAARRSGMKREQFGYVDGGYDVVLRRLHERLTEAGVDVRCGAAAEAVTSLPDGGVEVRCRDGAVVRGDAAALTVPASRVGALCPQLSDAERSRLDRVVYQGVACASMLLREPLADYYVTNITEPWVPFTAVIEMTALVDRERFGGNALVYLPRYLTQGEDFWSRSDEDIREEFLAALERMYPRFRREHVVAFQVARARDVLAIATLGYSREACPPTDTSVPGLYLVNSAQIVSGTLNLNETITLANRGAAALAAALRLPAAGEPQNAEAA